MKRNMMAKRMATAMLTGMMTMSMGMNAFAAVTGAEQNTGADAATKVQIKKTVTTDGKTFAPNATFGFTIEAGEGSAATATSPAIKAGVGVEDIVIGTVGFTSDSDLALLSSSYSGYANIDVSQVSYATPGIYHYVIKESIPEDDLKVKGVVYDETAKDIYVYVERDADANVVKAVVSSTDDGAKAASIDFVNNYGEEGTGKEDQVFDTTVYKKVTGNQGDRTAKYDFTLKITSPDDSKYFIVEVPGTDADDRIVVKANEEKTISLGDTESFTINGLVEGESYTVTEKSYADMGYATFVEQGQYTDETYSKTDKTEKNTIDQTADGIDLGNDVVYTVINDNNVTTPTGIILTFAPYVLMIAAAGIFAVMFLRKKREEF